MKQYIELGKRILAEGELRHDRTGVGTISVFDANGKIAKPATYSKPDLTPFL